MRTKRIDVVLAILAAVAIAALSLVPTLPQTIR